MTDLTFGSLFAGIGGIDLGFERAGMTCKWQVEIDDYCNKVLAKHWPDVARYRDVKEAHGAVAHATSAGREACTVDAMGARQQAAQLSTTRGGSKRTQRATCPSCLPPVDVITGGFPCQPHSVAGKRKGAADDRNLWPEYLRIVDELRPTWVVGENVPGIIHTYLDTVLSDLESIHYEVATFNLPAVAFDAPHRRERIFVVAYAESKRVNRISRNDSGKKRKDTDIRQYKSNSSGQNVAHAEKRTIRPGLCESEPGGQRRRRSSDGSGKINTWPTEPDVGGTLDGFSAWLDRTRLNESHVLYLAYANAKKERPAEILRILRSSTETKDQQSREAGRSGNIPEASVLLAYLRELQERETNQTWLQLAGAQASESEVRSVRAGDKPTRSPHRSRHLKQSQGEHPDTLQELSRLLAQHAEAAWLDYCGQDAETPLSNWAGDWEQRTPRVATGIPNRVDKLRGLGNAVVPQVAEFIGSLIVAADQERR